MTRRDYKRALMRVRELLHGDTVDEDGLPCFDSTRDLVKAVERAFEVASKELGLPHVWDE